MTLLRWHSRYDIDLSGLPVLNPAGGKFVLVRDAENYLNRMLGEAERLVRMSTQRYPLGITEKMASDAHHWLAERAKGI